MDEKGEGSMGKTMMRWVTGGLAAVMAVGGLVVPAWADDDDVKQIPTASADQWHPGWCGRMRRAIRFSSISRRWIRRIGVI